MRLRLVLSCFGFSLVSAPLTLAGEPVATASVLHANVENIEDRRSTRESVLHVALVFFGDDIDATSAILQTKGVHATDDTGREFQAVMPPARMRATLARIGGMPVPLRAVLDFRSPPRRATMLKVIEGSADVLVATEANGGLVTVPLPPVGRTVDDQAVARWKIQIRRLNDEEAARTRVEPSWPSGTVEEEQRRLDAVAAEVSVRRAQREAAAAQAGAIAGISSPGQNAAVPASAASPSAAEREVPKSTRVHLQIVDPEFRLAGLEWRDAKGEPLRVSFGIQTSTIRTFTFLEAVPADAHLLLHIAADEAIQTRPFRVENVALP
jgi:hypothetical protein